MAFNQYLSVCSITLSIIMLGTSCTKQNAFLNEKPNQALSTISTVTDIQLLLNNESVFNRTDGPGVGETSSDDYYVSGSNYLSRLQVIDQNAYIWAQQIYPAGTSAPDWDLTYQQVYYANSVLDALPKVSMSNQQQNTFKGSALFYRSFALYNLLQIYSLPYDSSDSESTLGIPLVLSSNISIKPTRATEAACYSQIIQDLTLASSILPTTSQFNTQPNKISAYALLARIYLAMGRYDFALINSNKVLQVDSVLWDYNTVIPSPSIARFADASQYPCSEDIYHSTLGTIAQANSYVIVDSNLYAMYDSTDLRKSLCYFLYNDGHYHFHGSYDFKNSQYAYDGLAVDEMYLIRAECYARTGNIIAAISDLNKLLSNRYMTGYFIPRSATSPDTVLSQVLSERRKELMFRGLRWTDLRRLNQDSRFAVTLTRILNGNTYTLPPNDPRYAIQIPLDEIAADNIPQNPR